MSELTVQELSELNSLATVVVPILNEREAISKVLDELFSMGLKNVLIVDGYSSDGTLDIVKKYPVSIIFQHGRGKAGALKTAFEKVKTPYMIIMDGDFTYDPSCIYRFSEHMQSYDEIIGVRHLDADKKNMSSLHKLGNKIINKIFNALIGTTLSDVCSGMYALRTEIVKDIDLSSTGFDIEVEIAAHIASSGRITEVPINYRERIGKQKLSSWSAFQIVYTIVKFAMKHRYTREEYMMKATVDQRLNEKDKEIQGLKAQMSKIIELLNYSNPKFPQSVLAMSDKDMDSMARMKEDEGIETIKQIADSDGRILSVDG